jgi:uncharacterized protein (DUF2132 family)
MHAAGPKNPLHGITLEKMLTQLQAHYGWEMLGRMIKVNCFNWQPSIKSSLTFLRKTPWARQKVEELYIDTLPDFQTGKSFNELYPPIGEERVAAAEELPSPAPDGDSVREAAETHEEPQCDVQQKAIES